MGRFEKISDENSDVKTFSWTQLENVSSGQVALHARSANMTQTRTVNFKDQAFQLSRCMDINLDRPFCFAVLNLGNQRLFIYFSPEMLEGLLDHGNLELMRTLSTETAAIVVEHFFLDVVTFLEGSFGESCIVEFFEIDAFELSSLSRSMAKVFYKLDSKSNDHTVYEMFIAGDLDLLFRITNFSENPIAINDGHEPQPDINVQVCHFGHDILLTYAEFDALRAGDGFVVEQTWSQRFDGHISIGGYRVGSVKQRRQNLVLTETPMLQNFSKLTSNGGLDMPLKIREKDNALGQNAYDEMPVQLSLQLAKHSLPLSKIGNLEKGDIVPFETLVSNEVRVLANGDIFAEAELVELNGKFAVRIREILV